MYYHCRPLKYVIYGKVTPPPVESYDDDWFLPAYKWLGYHCGYFPQIWLSRSTSGITGFKDYRFMKKRKQIISKRSNSKLSNDGIMFGFDVVKGFPLDYDYWELLLTSLIDHNDFESQNREIRKTLDSHTKCCLEYIEEEGGEIDNYVQNWLDCGRDLDTYLKKHLFQEVDQVVVPSLNLKVAKEIFCHNEQQKKKLRKMGFIEDRIKIQKRRPSSTV